VAGSRPKNASQLSRNLNIRLEVTGLSGSISLSAITA
jgi:hypothetical protein